MHTAQQISAHRAQKDAFFKQHPQSPLPPEARASFEGLAYYDYNPALAFTVTVDKEDDLSPIAIDTTTGDGRIYHRYGTFSFDVDGDSAQLTIYKTPHGFFLPFVDANAGKETYPAGRYLDLDPNDDGTFTVDFNLAYNPFCAYSDAYSCPLTPPENRLQVAIRAGEQISAT